MKTLELLVSERDEKLKKAKDVYESLLQKSEVAYQKALQQYEKSKAFYKEQYDKSVSVATRDYETATAKRKERDAKPKGYIKVADKIVMEKEASMKRIMEHKKQRMLELKACIQIEPDAEVPEDKKELFEKWSELRKRLNWLKQHKTWSKVAKANLWSESESIVDIAKYHDFNYEEALEYGIVEGEDLHKRYKEEEVTDKDVKNVDVINGLAGLLDEDEQIAELEQYEQNVKELSQESDTESVVSSLTPDQPPCKVPAVIEKVEPPQETVSVLESVKKPISVLNISMLQQQMSAKTMEQHQDRPKIISNTMAKKPVIRPGQLRGY